MTDIQLTLHAIAICAGVLLSTVFGAYSMSHLSGYDKKSNKQVAFLIFIGGPLVWLGAVVYYLSMVVVSLAEKIGGALDRLLERLK